MESGNHKKNMLPFSVQDRFFDFVEGKIAHTEFAKWLYENQELEQMAKDVYLELIPLDFGSSKAITEVRKIIDSYLDHGNREKTKMMAILNSLILQDGEFLTSLKKVYDLSCLNYYMFLSDLETNIYPLAFEVGVYYRNDWDRLSIIERKHITHPFYELIKDQAIDIIDKINNNTIVFTGELYVAGKFPG
jgi:hypothetical protein